MNRYEHLPLQPFRGDVQRKTRNVKPRYIIPEGREKKEFAGEAIQKADKIVDLFKLVRKKFSGIIHPSLIFEIKINQSIGIKAMEQNLSSMGIHILSVSENRKGFWVVFSDDENLRGFKQKLSSYGSEYGPNYDFFNAIETLQDIPREEKIGLKLAKEPLGDSTEYIDVELWRTTDPQLNKKFITELEQKYSDRNQFRITDTLIIKSFALLRIKCTKNVFDEIIELRDIARADRPAIPIFNPFELKNIDISDIERNEPDRNAAGILIIDSGIVSNHPLLEKCVGGEENFQTGEPQIQDTVGHGTSVAGCAVYGDIERCISEKKFTPSNWVFSAKVMYGETNPANGQRIAKYDPEKLVEHQLQEAVESFISNPDYHIRVVNISLGNANEIWHKNYFRQLPLAALIDELAYTFPNVLFIVSAGNQHPTELFDTIDDIVTGYPYYHQQNPDFKIINPATSALALTVGSITPPVRIQTSTIGDDQLKIPIAGLSEPSPFTRSGPGINGMIKPELVEYGGNIILYDNYGRISEDPGGKIALLNNQTTGSLIRFDYGTSYSTSRVAHIAGQIANIFPQRTANFISNMLLSSADYPFVPDDEFYGSKKNKALEDHTNTCGYGLPSFDRAISSFDNRTVLFDEGKLGLNRIIVFPIPLPGIFFQESGRKKIIVTLSFLPDTRATRGDSYLGNRMEFHLFHSISPQVLVEKYGIISEDSESIGVPEELKKFEIKLSPGYKKRIAGCHQKGCKEYKRDPRSRPASPVSLVLINSNKWMTDERVETDYCVSVIFEHEKEIDLYNQLRSNIQTRVRVR